TATMASGTLAPQMIRLKTSWPDRSIPMRKGPPGSVSSVATFGFGSNGARKGAKMARTTIARTIAMPIQTRMPANVFDWPRNRPTRRPIKEVRPLASQPAMDPLVPDSRVDERIQDIDAEADDDHEDSVVDDGALDGGVVAVADRLEHVASHALEGKYGLGEDGTAKQQGEGEAHGRDDGHKGVLQCVPKEHVPLLNAAGPRGLDIVRAHCVDHVHAGDPDEESGEDDPEGQRWQDQMGNRIDEGPEVPGEKAIDRVQARDGRRRREARRKPAGHRQPSEPDREDELEAQAKPTERAGLGQGTGK